MMVASRLFLNFIKMTFLKTLKTHILLYGYHLATWYSFPDITHIKVNNGLQLAILNLIELTFFMEYPYLKPHILFYSKWSSYLARFVRYRAY